MTSQPLARHLLRARDLADARYAEPLTVADMAGAAGAVAGSLQPRVQAGLRRVSAPVPADPAAGARGRPTAGDRLVRSRRVLRRGRRQRRVLHGELRPGLRPVARGLPPVVAAGGTFRPDSPLRGHGLRSVQPTRYG